MSALAGLERASPPLQLALACAGASLLVSCLVLGGGTSAGFLSDAVLQFLAIPVLLLAAWRLLDVPSGERPRAALLLCAAIVLVPLVQVLPLPASVWPALPGREAVSAVFGLLARDAPWMPVSVSPAATWLSALSLIPPVAVFLATISLDYRSRRLMTLVLLAVGIVSVFVGLAQVAQGPSSALRLYTVTNPTEAVGFFANRNHFAALLYTLTLLAAVWTVDGGTAVGSAAPKRRLETSSVAAVIAALTVLVVLVAAQVMTRSRAGLGLTIAALLGAFWLALSDRRVATGVSAVKLLLGAIALALLLTIQFTLYRVLERFAVDPLGDARIGFARNTMEATKAYMPLGSGIGTFVPVYAMFEKPQDALVNAYANHAHNDILELCLEAGVLAIGLMGVFGLWLVMTSASIWRRPLPGMREFDHSLARAATMIIALLVAHSFVDYPLRTEAMMAVFAFACALLVRPVGLGEEPSTDDFEPTRPPADRPDPTSRTEPRRNRVPAEHAPVPVPHGRESLGPGFRWPEEWRSATAQDAADGLPPSAGSGPRK